MVNDTLYAKIRTWDSMLQEYGPRSSSDTNIAVPNVFTQEMENAIPADRIIEVKQLGRSSFKWHPEPRPRQYYIISKEMIEQHYGIADPRIGTSIVVPNKDTKISEPVYNHTRHEYYLASDKNYLHSDMIIRTSTMPYETGYYILPCSLHCLPNYALSDYNKKDYYMTSLNIPSLTIPLLTLTLLVALDLFQGV